VSDRVDTVKDIIFFNATPADIRRMARKIEDYKRWLVETRLPNNLDNWQSYCEMCQSEE
jgi:hypothetical protein